MVEKNRAGEKTIRERVRRREKKSQERSEKKSRERSREKWKEGSQRTTKKTRKKCSEQQPFISCQTQKEISQHNTIEFQTQIASNYIHSLTHTIVHTQKKSQKILIQLFLSIISLSPGRLWRHYFPATEGLIFVIDSQDKDRISEAKYELDRLVEEEDLKKCPLLVFA